MWKLVPTLTREMGQAYPELTRAEALISETLKLEETRFRKTLERGLAILDEESKGLKKGDRLKGETAFTLYDTYGFPLDLTQDALRARGIEVDTDAFGAAMERQREKAREVLEGLGRRRDRGGVVCAARATRRHRIPRLRDRERRGRGRGAGEGRQGGRRRSSKGERRRRDRQPDAVLRRIRRPGRRHRRDDRRGRALPRHRYRRRRPAISFVHFGTVEEGTLKPGLALSLEVDHARRSAIRQNHSATHLLHEALRQVLGDHVAQKGSLVAPDRLRFDFSHPKPMSAAELEQVEDIANDIVDPEFAGDHAADGGGRGDRVRRARAVRREIRRRGARRRDGRAAATPWAGRWSCAAARMCGAPATSGSSRWWRRPASPRACAASRR